MFETAVKIYNKKNRRVDIAFLLVGSWLKPFASASRQVVGIVEFIVPSRRLQTRRFPPFSRVRAEQRGKRV